MHLFTIRMVLAASLLVPVVRGQNQAGDVSLVIRFPGGVSHFKVGEVIPVEMSFRASTPGKYSFNTASYDRSGRLGIDQFELEPKGRDPLYSYFHDMIEISEMGGLYTVLPLGDEPQVLERSLNEWVVPEKPGHYRLRVVSQRVGRGLTSSTLEFDLDAADGAWQERTLAEIVSVLHNPASAQKERMAAGERLRYLDTVESVRELARQLTKPGDEENQWNFEAGLLGARDQDLAFREVEARFDAPDAALGEHYLWLVATLEFARARARSPQITKEEDFTPRVDAVYQRALDALPLKQGAAKAATVASLLEHPHEGGPRVSEAEIAAAFPMLDRRQQERILNSFPGNLKVPSMAGPLADILDQPKLGAGTMLRVNALRLLLQVNPQMGRERMLAEMRAPHADSLNVPGPLIRCLSQLPDATLPEMNQLLVERLETAEYPALDFYAGLTGRYADAAILPQVKTIYRKRANSWSGDGLDGMMRYFLRVDPDFGRGLFEKHGSSRSRGSGN